MFIVKLKNSFIEIFYDSKKIFIVLFKVIVPIVIIIRALELLGLIPVFAKYLEPLTSFVGIDGSLGLVIFFQVFIGYQFHYRLTKILNF